MNPIMISLNMDKIEALDSANLKPDSFTLDQSARVTIKVYNVAGQLVEWIAQANRLFVGGVEIVTAR